MKKKIIESLKFVAKSFLACLLQNIYQAMFSTASLLLLFLSLKDNIWNSATNLLRTTIGEPPSNLLLWHLLLGFLLIPLCFSLGYKAYERRIRRNPFTFIEQYGFAWRVDKNTGEVKNFPFCKEHRVEIEMKEIYNDLFKETMIIYLCPVCGNKYTQKVNKKFFEDSYEIIVRKAEAKHYGYGRGFK
ncbi:MAG: hypothetical protein A2315_00985 [Ignavibacteria bacterium RIFOXYB2_FULL_35_12]|nr:MAG: hypothetical protein A2006_02605 [Ignavibacteria bacterium GWC2_35_8]OGV00598.1 MAG: hypothetical protein A2455_10355 [Ignavibacteria bacterium RIFOXYC2_FULL_35_16]OGV05564.1 MAG: hypothetical protein A2315_00985 [Ignavibacteria bacterium RIFOXYB2_FULL_35_12]